MKLVFRNEIHAWKLRFYNADAIFCLQSMFYAKKACAAPLKRVWFGSGFPFTLCSWENIFRGKCVLSTKDFKIVWLPTLLCEEESKFLDSDKNVLNWSKDLIEIIGQMLLSVRTLNYYSLVTIWLCVRSGFIVWSRLRTWA